MGEHEPAEPAALVAGRRPGASGKDFAAGLAVLAVALYTLVDSIRMPFFDQGLRGFLTSPGLTPGLLSLGLVGMSVALMVRARGFALKRPAFRRPSVEALRVLAVVGILAAYILLLPVLGYIVATFLMLATFQTVFARRHTLGYVLTWCIGLSAVLTAVLYYAFAHIFLIPMP